MFDIIYVIWLSGSWNGKKGSLCDLYNFETNSYISLRNNDFRLTDADLCVTVLALTCRP